ncbi:MAG: outer membrane protein assembly factor BamA [Bacteroidetes bacterium]|nr:outer membrane protein assembly factor BamA [Bacteroidota bacterium]
MPKNLPITWLIISFSLLFVFTSETNSQVRPKNYKILGISVEGNSTTDANTIIANSGLRVGDEFQIPGDETINAIKRLWKLTIFSDVQILIDKELDDGVFLIIKVDEYPRLDRYVITGDDEISKDDIEEKIGLVGGQTLKPQSINKIKLEIEKLYEEEGLLNAQITPVIYEFAEADTTDETITTLWRETNNLTNEYELEYEYTPNRRYVLLEKLKNRKLLEFKIDEGSIVEINQVSFNGNEKYDDDELRGELEETTETAWYMFWKSNKFNKKGFETDKDLLKNFYRKNGFRDFEIESDSLALSEDKTLMDVVVNVYEGPQYFIRNIDFTGNTLYSDEELFSHVNMRKGDIFDFEKLNQNLRFNEAQDDVSSLYQNFGYLAFNLQVQEEKVAEDSLDINIKIIEGSRFRIGTVKIEGNDRTKDKVIRRELYTIPGDYFSRSTIMRSIQQLSNLTYFNVEELYKTGVDYKPENDSTVAIIINVQEKSSEYFNASVGYSGAFGLSGSIGLTLNNFSITEPFQIGGGQQLSFNWQFGVGNFYRTFSLGFSEPWFMNTPTMIGFDVFDTRQRYIYDLRQSGGTLKVGRRLKWPDNYFYLMGMFKFQYNNVLGGAGFYREGLSRQYTVGATISRTDIDNPIFPSTGSKIQLDAQLSGGPFLPGDVDYLKINLKTEWYKRLFNSNRVALFTSVDIGYLKELSDDTIVQPFEYFFMGGNGLIIATTPLRGYDDRSVGPRSADGNIIGGKVKARFIFELRGALALEPVPIYLLAFAEAGNVFYDIKDTDFFNLRRSVGIGARLLIQPIGMIGFDYGYGFDRKLVDGKEPTWEFHFQYGQGL